MNSVIAFSYKDIYIHDSFVKTFANVTSLSCGFFSFSRNQLITNIIKVELSDDS